MQTDYSNRIHDLIQTFPLGESSEMIASKLLDILQLMNERMDQMDAEQYRTANIASCLANGIRPD